MSQSQALLLSLLVEVPLALLVVVAARWTARLTRVLLVAITATLLSHPVAWMAITALQHNVGYWAAVAAVELVVTAFEAALYARLARLGWQRGAVVSAAANAGSLLLGVVWVRIAS